MNLPSPKIEDTCCPRFEIAEYLDGELSSREELDLELHFAGCRICANEINAQKKVSSTLEILLEEEKDEIPLPENFIKVITTKAETNLDGLRCSKERSRGLFICAMLFLIIAFGFGLEGRTVNFALETFTDQFMAVGGFIFHLFYTLSLGVSAVFGSLCKKFIFSSTLTLLTIVTVFVFASMILSRLVIRFNRT